MSTFSSVLNSNTTPVNKLLFGDANNVLVITESSPPSSPFSASSRVSLSYSTPGVTYTFSNVSVTSFTSTTLTVNFKVIASSGPGVGGNSLRVSIINPTEILELQTIADQ